MTIAIIYGLAMIASAATLRAQDLVSFPSPDGGVVYADLYGTGARGVVLAHGGRFTKESWAPQARALAKAGFRAVSIAYRGEGQSRGGTPATSTSDSVHLDVLAAVRYLRRTGATTVAVVGASFGGDAAADASIVAQPGEIDRMVLLAHGGYAPAERMKGRKLFIVARDDANAAGLRLPRIARSTRRRRARKSWYSSKDRRTPSSCSTAIRASG